MSSDESKPERPVKIDVGVGAKASVEARISTEIQAESSGRLLDTLTDIIRPFAERRGLKADQIRLQREDVLIEIARKARQRLLTAGHNASPIPNKFLIPFLEKASLEEEGSVLIDRWADLLTSSAIDPGAAHPRFVQILSEITGEEARFLKKISYNGIDTVEYPRQKFEDCSIEFQKDTLHKEIIESINEINEQNIDSIFDEIFNKFHCPGVLLDGLTIYSYDSPIDENSLYKEWNRHVEQGEMSCVDILSSINVLTENFIDHRWGSFELSIIYTCLTSLGIDLLLKCDRDLDEKLR